MRFVILGPVLLKLLQLHVTNFVFYSPKFLVLFTNVLCGNDSCFRKCSLLVLWLDNLTME